MSINPLHPFVGRTAREDNVPIAPIGTSLPSGQKESFDPNSARGIGFRSPMVLVGWGYDVFGRPVPNNIGDFSATNNYDNNSGVKFSGGFPYPSGGLVNPADYIAGPLDAVFNPRTGCWQGEKKFLAKITSTGLSLQQTLYGWEEIRFLRSAGNTTDRVQAYSETYPAKGRANIDSSFAINLAELGPAGNNIPALPSGTIVEMSSIRVLNSDNNTYEPYYYFDSFYNGPILGYITDSTLVDDNKYQYEATICRVGVNATGIRPILSATTVTAWNLIETSNTESWVGPGVDMTGADYPAGFAMIPITDVIVELKLIPEQTAIYYFSVVNAHDGTCT